MPYHFLTYTSPNLLAKIQAAGADHFVNPDVAIDGDIIGACIDTKSSSGRHSYALSYHINEYIVMGPDGLPLTRHWKNLDENKQASAALLSMKLADLNLVRHSSVEPALFHMDGGDSDLYANIYCLPSLVLIYTDMFEDVGEFNMEYEEETQQEIEMHFSVIKARDESHHQSLNTHSDIKRDLDLLHNLLRIREDFSEEGGPLIKPGLSAPVDV